ncbi:MAG: HAD family phosphatase [Proteobacteria bacterium]|nr:HAD family phosphatase [Pseudomonadota bacterium]
MTAYAAAIFDLDGLLLDTERLAIATGYEALDQLGQPRIAGLLESLIGKDDAAGARIVSARYGDGFPQEDFARRWSVLFQASLDRGIPLRPGATALLDRLGSLGLPCAVATSSRRASALRKLDLTGLAPRFATVVTVDCILNPKPAPDPYLEAARRLAVAPARCIAFEDSDTGAAAAHAAGMTVVQVPDMAKTTGPHAHHLAGDLIEGARMAGLI